MAIPSIPEYRDLRLIGRGGFAQVFQAAQPAFGGRIVAVKVLTIDDLDEGRQERFERECHAAGRISWHPNVVKVYDAGTTEDGRPYLVMEHLGRGALSDMVESGPISWQEAVAFTVPVAGALEAAHRADLVHRDVKPANVLIGPLDEPKLADFGIARIEGATASRTQGVRATLAHASPEALEGTAGPSSDVYALASTFFELVAGRPAFVRPDDETITPIVARIMSAAPPDLRSHGVPDAVASVIEQAMAKDPAGRPPSAEAFGQRLQGAASSAGAPPVRMVVAVDEPMVRTPVAPAGPDSSETVHLSVPEAAGSDSPAPAPVAPVAPDPQSSAEPATASPAPAPTSSPALDPNQTVDLSVALPLASEQAVDPPVAEPQAGDPPAGDPPVAEPPAPPPSALGTPAGPKRRRLPLLLAAGALLLLGVVGVVVSLSLLLQDGDDDPSDGSGSSTEQADAGDESESGDEVSTGTDDPVGPDGEQLEVISITVGPSPLGVAVSDDAVYVANMDDDTMSLLDLGTGAVQTTVPVEGRPRRVAAAADDGVWVTLPETSEVAKVNQDGVGQRLPVGADPIGVAEGLDSAWIVNGGSTTVSRIGATSQELEATITDVGADPRQVVTGGDGVWVSDVAGDEVVRIDPATDVVTDRIPVGEDPIGMGFGEGSVWVTSQAAGTVSRIDPESLEVLATIEVGAGPVAVAVSQGAVWVTNQGDDTVSRIDPSTDEVTETLDVGAGPGGVAVGGGAVWVTNMDDGTVSRIVAG